MRRIKIQSLTLLLLFASACSTLASIKPKSFDQGLAVGYATQTSVLHTTTSLLNRHQIGKDDAKRVLAISDQAGQALDSARAMRTADMRQAEAQMTLATTILDQIIAYLQTKGK